VEPLPYSDSFRLDSRSGGWSIGVEFCFYLVFPFLATIVTNLRRAMVFFAIPCSY
jgi:peptidoglycan/LPS O-acetylase OafA/YrhL